MNLGNMREVNRMPFRRFVLVLVITLVTCSHVPAQAPPPAAVLRGKLALETRAFNLATWSVKAYDAAWTCWGKAEKQAPDNYGQAFRDYYGMHPAPFDNGKYPMGLREGQGLIGKGLTADCLVCHGGSILGKSHVGLGNSTLEIQDLFQDMSKAGGGSGKLPFTFSNVRGTSEAAAFAVFLIGLREPNLDIRLKPMALDLKTDLCEDVPAWWLLKKKKTMYYTGSTPAKSVRSIMQFMLASTHPRSVFEQEEKTFADIQAYILSLTPPRYPYPIDSALAAQGEKVFEKTCAKCHGTYGKDWTYPNKIVPLDVIGTDPNRFYGISAKWGQYYNQSWFAQKELGTGIAYPVQATNGYQAPPLDGIWATAPYLHNGSVPTLHHLLSSKTRPMIFTRSYQTDAASYDKEHVGWKVQVLQQGADPTLPLHEQRKVYDTRLPGRSNAGHTFGDSLSEDERRALIEYLKTL
jgi:mono/diheme cytochrome c family protein